MTMEREPNDNVHIEQPASPITWDYQPDPEVVEVLAETATETQPTGNRLAQDDSMRAQADADLTAQDPDARPEYAAATGEEAVGGSSPTPEQNDVDDLGKAWGVTYQDDEPLQTDAKLSKRDRKRAELEPTEPEQGG